MTIATLHDLYIDQLQDIHSADSQSRAATAELAEVAENPHLDSALHAGVDGIDRGMEAVASILARHDSSPREGHCEAMAGLVREAQHHAIDSGIADSGVRDAMIIAQYQRMTHYAIAVYGSLVAFAQRLGYEDDAATLEACLTRTRDGDKHLSEIATRDVNRKAA